MKKPIRNIILLLFVAFVVIQFIPIDRDNPPVQAEIPAPPEVRMILRSSCYNCHSNETTWPWYSSTAPVSWLVASDVHEGRGELNFSTWNLYNTKQQAKKLQRILKEITEGDMPPWYYLLMHRDAALSAQKRAVLQTWARGSTAPDTPAPTSPQQGAGHTN